MSPIRPKRSESLTKLQQLFDSFQPDALKSETPTSCPYWRQAKKLPWIGLRVLRVSVLLLKTP